MSALNSILNQAFGALWAPFAGLDPWIGLLLWSIVVGVAALYAMKWCSNQERITVLKDRYKAHVIAIRLFRDDLWIVLLSMGRTLWTIARYMGHQLRPMLVLIVPIVLLFAQMQMRLAYEPLPLGQKVLVEVQMTGVRPGLDAQVELALPQGVELAGVVVPEVATRKVKIPLRATAPGAHELRLRCGTEEVTKSLHAGPAAKLVSLSPVRSAHFVDLLLYPTEQRFPEGSRFESIKIPYGIKPLSLFGIDWSFGMELGMGIVFMVISIVAALLLKDLVGVTI